MFLNILSYCTRSPLSNASKDSYRGVGRGGENNERRVKEKYEEERRVRTLEGTADICSSWGLQINIDPVKSKGDILKVC